MRKPVPSREKRFLADLKRHEGQWSGRHLEVDGDGAVTDRYDVRTECSFPRNGPYAFRQEQVFTWADGETQTAEMGGLLAGARLRFDTELYIGEIWSRHGSIFFDGTHKRRPGIAFRDIMLLGPGGLWRTRTRHWFEDGRCVRRTLVDERLV